MATVKPARISDHLPRDGKLRMVPYLMGGYPSVKESIAIGRALVKAGAAVVEVGVPYSDPLADGPVIQAAGQKALEAGITLPHCLEVAEGIAREGAPVVLMTYVNPVLAYDPRRFAADAAQAGVSGVIIPDLPIEESEPVAGWIDSAGLDTVFMVAPTSGDERMARICEKSRGFVYCVTLTGVTGVRAKLPADLSALLRKVRSHTELPIAAGFGVSTREQVKAMAGLADAVVVGSALVREVSEGRSPQALFSDLHDACR